MKHVFLFLFNSALFVYIMAAGSLLIVTRFFPALSPVPQSGEIAGFVEIFVQQLKQAPAFLGLLVLPSFVFVMFRLRSLSEVRTTL